MPPNGRVRGEWFDVRPRRGKAQEQVDGRRDRRWEDQRHGGFREQRQGQSRVRIRYGSSTGFDSEDDGGFCERVLSHDGKVVIQYSRPGRPVARQICTSFSFT